MLEISSPEIFTFLNSELNSEEVRENFIKIINRDIFSERYREVFNKTNTVSVCINVLYSLDDHLICLESYKYSEEDNLKIGRIDWDYDVYQKCDADQIYMRNYIFECIDSLISDLNFNILNENLNEKDKNIILSFYEKENN